MAILLAEATAPAPDAAATASGNASTEQPAEHAVFPPFDSSTFASQLVWLAITFIVLYVLMKRWVIPQVGGILATRAARIASDLDQAQQAKAQSEAAVAGYEKSLAAARANANTIAAKARDEAKAAADVERAGTEAELNKKIAASEASIAAIKQRALAEVGGIAGDTAAAIVKALVGADVPDGDVRTAVSDVMKAGS